MSETEKFFNRIMEDADFRLKFQKAPNETLKQSGVTDFDGVDVRVWQNDSVTMHFALMEKGCDLTISSDQDPRFMEIQKKFWEDEKFRTELLSDPMTIARNYFGFIPQGITIKMHVNTPDTLNLVLPRFTESDELSDSDLDAVAGGKGGSNPIAAINHLGNQVCGNIASEVNNTMCSAAATLRSTGQEIMDLPDRLIFDPLTDMAKDALHNSGVPKAVGQVADQGMKIVGNILSGW